MKPQHARTAFAARAAELACLTVLCGYRTGSHETSLRSTWRSLSRAPLCRMARP
jgi:hypothetical protein